MINKDMRMPGWRGGDGDAAYLDKTLRHRSIELSLDDRVNWRVIVGLWLRGFIASLIVPLPFVFLGFLMLAGSAEAFGVMLFLAQAASFIAFWVVFLLSKLPEPIAEWRVLLADRRDRADAVYSAIAGTLNARRIPIAASYRRLYTGLGSQQVSNRLVLREGHYVAYVSVFGYGTSLYLGWMMWRSRRGAALVWQYLTDVVAGILGRNDPEVLMLRTERARAMREAVHALCREGLIVGIENVNVPISFGFPHGLPPVENSADMPAAPRPFPPPGSGPSFPPPGPGPSAPPPVRSTPVPPPAGNPFVPPPAGDTSDLPPAGGTHDPFPGGSTSEGSPDGSASERPPAGSTEPPPAGDTSEPPPSGSTSAPPPQP